MRSVIGEDQAAWSLEVELLAEILEFLDLGNRLLFRAIRPKAAMPAPLRIPRPGQSAEIVDPLAVPRALLGMGPVRYAPGPASSN